MKRKQAVVIGDENFLLDEICNEITERGWNVNVCYVKRRNKHIKTSTKNAMEINRFQLNTQKSDFEHRKEIFSDARLVIDISSSKIEKRLALQEQLSVEFNIDDFIHITNEYVDESLIRKGTYVVHPDIVFSSSSDIYNEVVAMASSKMTLTPVSPMAIGRPIHVKDFSHLIASLCERIVNKGVNVNLFSACGRNKMTLKYFLSFIARDAKKSFFFIFNIPLPYGERINTLTRNYAEWGYSEKVWDELLKYGKTSSAISLADYLSERVLALEAR